MDEILQDLKSAGKSLIAKEAITQLEGLSSSTLSSEDQARFSELLRLIDAEAQAELLYADKFGENEIASTKLRADLIWLRSAGPASSDAAAADLKNALVRLAQLITEIESESQSLQDVPEAAHFIAVANFFKASAPADISHVRWLIVVLSLLLYLIKAHLVLCKQNNSIRDQTEAESRLRRYLPLLKAHFPLLPLPDYSTQNLRPTKKLTP